MKHFQVLWFTYEKKLPTTHPINGLPYMPMQSLQIQKLLAYNAKKNQKKPAILHALRDKRRIFVSFF